MKHLTLLFALLLPIAALPQDAPMFRGDLAHTGVYNAAGVPKFGALKWKFQTGGRVVSSPAIVAGVAYVGSTDGNLYAVDTATGAQKWKFATTGWVSSSPAVSSGIVYFESYDGNFYAVEAATGQLKWQFQTAGERHYAGTHLHGMQPAAESMPDPWDFFLSSPSVWNGAVYFGSGDSNIYALDANSGALKWKFKTGDVVHSSPAIADGTLFIGSWDSYLYALDAATGKEKWRFKTGEDPDLHNHVGIQASPAVADGSVFFGCRDGNVYAVDAFSGKQKWLFSTNGSWVNNSAVVHDGKIYVGTSIPSNVGALDAKTGALLVHWPGAAPIFSSMALAADKLYFGNFSGKLTAVDLKTQTPAWTFETEASKKNAPPISNADGTIKFETLFPSPLFYDDMVLAVAKLYTTGTFLSSPVIVGNVIYIGSADGYLYALM
jgi:outer membrane protein assembly factor BamB